MDELDDKLQELARDYHEPPAAPRDEMWARIQARRTATPAAPPKVLPFRLRPAVPVRRYAAWAAGAAAVLLLGIAIGRGTSHAPSAPATIATAPVPAPATGAAVTNVALDAAVRAHLRQSETYLTLFRASVRGGTADPLAVSTARELLASNRFLTSASGTDPKLRALLLDLQLVLVGISQLQAADRPEDFRLITDNLDDAGMLSRLRSATPRAARPYPTGVI